MLVVTVQTPFVTGGAELLAAGLVEALRAAGHEADLVAIPFRWWPPEAVLDQMLACRLFDLGEATGGTVDRVIGLKFPAYLVRHPNKVLWLLHQYRQAYDLWDHPLGALRTAPDGAHVRDAILQADSRLIPEAKAVFTISATVAQRLTKHCGLDATPLYHPPPHADAFWCAEPREYLFFPSRLAPLKRQTLVLESLARTRHPVRVRFAGTVEHATHLADFRARVQALGLGGRAEWLGAVNEEDKRALYAHALGVVFPPHDEDYGYVTLEAMLAGKPVVTCADSGGPLEFVRAGVTGLVADPTPEALGAVLDALWDAPAEATRMGAAGRRHYEGLEVSWRQVVQRLTS